MLLEDIVLEYVTDLVSCDSSLLISDYLRFVLKDSEHHPSHPGGQESLHPPNQLNYYWVGAAGIVPPGENSGKLFVGGCRNSYWVGKLQFLCSLFLLM